MKGTCISFYFCRIKIPVHSFDIACGTKPSNSIVPIQHSFAFGGPNPQNYSNSFVPFNGVKFFQKFGQYAIIGTAHLQYNFLRKFYATALSDLGSNQWYFEDLIDFRY